MNALQYTPAALRDLDEIWEYIANELCNPEAANSTVNAILDAAERLRAFPYSGAALNSILRIESDYRFIVSGHYLAFYHVQGEAVFIDRVLYERRDCLRAILENQ